MRRPRTLGADAEPPKGAVTVTSVDASVTAALTQCAGERSRERRRDGRVGRVVEGFSRGAYDA